MFRFNGLDLKGNFVYFGGWIFLEFLNSVIGF